MELLEALVVLFLCAVALGWAARQVRVPYPIMLVPGCLVHLLARFSSPSPGDILACYRIGAHDHPRRGRHGPFSDSNAPLGCSICPRGAIISPPDAVAATAVLSRFKLSKRIVTILEGESLVNDASGLVLYKFAVTAAVTGTFSVLEAAGGFIYMAAAGLGLGYAMGQAFVAIHKRLRDPQTEIMLSIALPYAAYLLAETLHLSGVLAVVAAGLVRGRHAPEVLSAQSRLLGYAVWNIIVFFINALVFMTIGLQLSGILARLSGYPPGQLARFALAVSGVAILVRLSWVFPAAYLPSGSTDTFAKLSPGRPGRM